MNTSCIAGATGRAGHACRFRGVFSNLCIIFHLSFAKKPPDTYLFNMLTSSIYMVYKHFRLKMATSRQQSGFVNSWQNRKTVTECNLHMLETEDFSDVTFRVGSEKHVVRAHRYVLVSRSCVFHAMFCGPLVEKGEITVPDIEVGVFKDFLRYLYTDSVHITSNNATGLLYTSRKYDVQTLFDQSVSFLETSLNEENVATILEHSHHYTETDLETKALGVLTNAGMNVTKSKGFLDLCKGCFEKFLKSRSLKMSEEEVFEAAMSWSQATCARESLSPSRDNYRTLLGDLVYEIRFSSMSQDFIVKVVGPSKLLTSDERIAIMDKNINPDLDISPFKSDARSHGNISERRDERMEENFVSRFTSRILILEGGGQHAISFSANQDIDLLGIQLYGRGFDEDISPFLSVSVQDHQGVIRALVQESQWTFREIKNDIIFPGHVIMFADQEYTIIVNMSAPTTGWGTQGKPEIISKGVKFTFRNAGGFETKTSVFEGQIPTLIWRKRR